MSLKWKEYLYFRQSDKNAIILLCILIVLCGLACLFANFLFNNNYNSSKDEAFAEFDRYQKEQAGFNRQISEPESGIIKDEKTNPQTKKKPLGKLTAGESIDINAASLDAVKRIPGIGEEYAKRIIDYRNRLGGLTSTRQLMEIKGITSKRHEKLSPYIRIGRKPRMININKQEYEKLITHPYINEKLALSIINHRERNGHINNMDELSGISGFTPADADRLSPYISFDR